VNTRWCGLLPEGTTATNPGNALFLTFAAVFHRHSLTFCDFRLSETGYLRRSSAQNASGKEKSTQKMLF
jgi:hypothetical protein